MKKNDLVKFTRALNAAYTDAGDNLLIACPFAKWTHKSGKDKSPSMSLKVNDHGDSMYHCFGCREQGGSLETMMLRLMGYGFDRAVTMQALDVMELAEKNLDAITLEYEEAIRDQAPIRLSIPPHPTVATIYPEEVLQSFAHEGREGYMRKRGLRPETADLFDIRYDPKFDRVLIPVRWHTGELVGAIGRLCHAARELAGGRMELPYYNYWRFPKATLLFGEHLLKPEPVVVCEGPFDAIKVRQAGFNGVAVMGARFSEHQVNKLVEWGQPVVVFFDADDTGDEFGEKMAKELDKKGVPTVRIAPPKGNKDAGSMSSEALQKILTKYTATGVSVATPVHW